MPAQAQKTDKKSKTPATAPSSTSTATKEAGDEAQAKLGNAALQEALVGNAGREPEGVGKGRRNYREALGGKVGDLVYDQIEKHVTDEKAGELAASGVGSLFKAGRNYLDENIDSPDKAKLFEAIAPLEQDAKAGARDKVAESGIGSGLRGVLDEHPYLTTGAALAGVAAYIGTNQDLPLIKGKVGLGEHGKLTAGVDPGRTLDLALEQVELGYQYKNGGTDAAVKGDWYQDGGWKVGGHFQQALDPGERVRLEGMHVDRPGENRSRLDLSYVNPNLTASAYWERMRGEKTVDAFGGSIANVQKDPKDIKAYLRGEYRTDGSYTAAGGLSQQLDDKSWALEGYAGRDVTGKEDAGIRAMFKWRF